METDQDRLLIDRLRSGDNTAVAEIRTRYQPELQLFCRRMVYNETLAEDIVQDVLLKCCKTETAGLPAGSLRGWLYQVARNRSIDELRRMKPDVRLSAAQSESHLWANAAVPVDPTSTPAGKAIKADRVRRVQLAIDAMDDGLREVVILYFFQGLSRSEVAEAIGLTLAGTKARLSKATRELRRRLQADRKSVV